MLKNLIFFLIGMSTLACKKERNNIGSNTLHHEGMVLVPSGELSRKEKSESTSSHEFSRKKIKIDAFWMDESEVTNKQFAKFIQETNYTTVAERPVDWQELKRVFSPDIPKPPDSLLLPGALVFHASSSRVALNHPENWWRWVVGACWKYPEGPKSSIEQKENHPVVQIAWEDAKAYATWAGKRLPTESEWEWAARGGNENQMYPWGDELLKDGNAQANYWQGIFPFKNTMKDGFDNTAPVKSFEANGYGLYDMAGNVWEWCSDCFDEDQNQNEQFQPERVVRGGSFLCNDDYCSGYRNSERMGTTPNTSLSHTGFRCVKDVIVKGTIGIE